MDLFKAFGLKKADEEHSDEWWDKMLKIAYNMDVPYKEREEQLKAAGFDVENDFDALMEKEPPELKTTSLEEDIERFKREAPHMGMTAGEISDIIRDLGDDPNNPKHRDLRQQIMSPEWGLKIRGKSPNAKQDEIVGSYLAGEKNTEAVGNQVFDQFVRGVGRTGSSAGGGRAMSGQGNIADIQTGWPKVQPPTAQQFEDEPRLRNASGLNKMDLFKTFGIHKASGTTDVSSQNPGDGSNVELGGGKHRPSSQQEDVHNPSEGTDPATEEEEEENGNGE